MTNYHEFFHQLLQFFRSFVVEKSTVTRTVNRLEKVT